MEDIDKLISLVERLSINEKAFVSRIEEEDKEGIIYGLDSDDDSPTYRMTGQMPPPNYVRGEGSGNKRSRTPTPTPNYTPPPTPPPRTPPTQNQEDLDRKTINNRLDRSFTDFTYTNNYLYSKGKIKRDVPLAYQEKERSITNGMLNIDCTSNTEKLILQWINQNKLLVQTEDSTISSLTLEDFDTYILYKTTGIVNSWLRHVNRAWWDPISSKSKAPEEKIRHLNNLAEELYVEFLGYKIEEHRVEDRDDTIRMLSNMAICNPCYLEEFFCQVEEYYYRDKERTGLLELVLGRMPLTMAGYIKEKIREEERKDPRTKKTLGLIKRLAKDYRKSLCIDKMKQKEIYEVGVNCCKQLEEVPQKYGCKPEKRFRNKKYRYYNKYRKYKKRRWKPSYRDNKFRKRGYRKNYIRKFKSCPSGKPKDKCRCWICQEEGHYANECPNKNRSPNKYKKVQMLYSLGFEPIEEDYSDEESLDFDLYSVDLNSEEYDINSYSEESDSE